MSYSRLCLLSSLLLLSITVCGQSAQSQATQPQPIPPQSAQPAMIFPPAPKDPQAVSVLNQALSVAGGAAAIKAVTDYSATGNITYNGNPDEQGTVTVQGLMFDQIRLDANLSRGTHSSVILAGQSTTKAEDGTLTQYPPAYPIPSSEVHLYQPPLFPACLILPHAQVVLALNSPRFTASYKGNKLLDSSTVLDYSLLMENKTMSEPKSLQEAILYFSNPDNCLSYLVARRWPKGVVCPTCGSEKVSFSASRRIWQCGSHHAKRQFSVKVGTIFEDSPIGLDKWLAATWMLTNCKNGISSYEVARALGVTQKSAWFMLHRIRLALQDENFGKLGGEVEVDETFIGGFSRNMHLNKRALRITGTGMKDKTPVVGILRAQGQGSHFGHSQSTQEGPASQSPGACHRGLCSLHRCAAFVQRP